MNNSTTITNLTNLPPTSPCVMSIDFGTTESIVMATLHSLIGILSIFGNFLILVAIYCTPSLHLVSNYFLASLAVSDLVVGVLLSPMWVARAVLHVWQVNHPLTIATSWLTVFTTIATTLNLCAVSFDRYWTPAWSVIVGNELFVGYYWYWRVARIFRGKVRLGSEDTNL